MNIYRINQIILYNLIQIQRNKIKIEVISRIIKQWNNLETEEGYNSHVLHI